MLQRDILPDGDYEQYNTCQRLDSEVGDEGHKRETSCEQADAKDMRIGQDAR